MADDQSVILAIDGPIATLTLNRPAVRNAIDPTTHEQFVAGLETVVANESVRALIVTGAPPAFCSGGDIKNMGTRLATPPGQVAIRGWRRQRHMQELVATLHRIALPTFAAVNGAATGVGADIALACDFVVASESAMFQMSYVLRGLIPDGGGMYFLPRRVGLAKAKDLFFSGRRVSGAEAVAMGLADRLVAPDALLAETRRWALEMCAQSAPAVALIKSIMDRTFESSPEVVYEAGAQALAIAYTTDEHQSAVREFLKK